MPVLGSRKISALGKLSHAVSPPTMYGVYLTAIFLRRVEVPNSRTKKLEARVGFEPTNGGFADLSLGPLGYRAELFSITKSRSSVRARENAVEENLLSLCGFFDSLQLFAWLKAHGFSRWDVHFFTGARVAPDPRLARLHAENTKAPQLNTLAAAERIFQ